MNSILKEERLLTLFDRYMPLPLENEEQMSYRDYYSRKVKNLEQSEFLIPVLGVQGAGKSSFLNALLMEDLILPVDADETTSIPVEIRYSKEKNGQMEVYFNNRDDIVKLEEPKQLEQYAHNAYNYGNEKNVSHIVIYSVNELLKNDVVFVDLPGVSSLTHANVATTMNYIDRLSAAIFLLRTVPPITRSEYVFLNTVWPKLSTAWFIQNQWNDESSKEVEDGLIHNKSVLEKIVTNHPNSDQHIDIRIVNVYQAMSSRFTNDDKGLEESGIMIFSEYIKKIGQSWKQLLKESFYTELQELIDQLTFKLGESKRKLNLDRREARREYRKQERALEDAINENKLIISKLNFKIRQLEADLHQFAQAESKKQAENLRNEMRRVTGSNIVDGEILTKVFQDHQKEVALEAIEALNEKLYEVRKQLETDLESLQINYKVEGFDHYEQFSKASALKFEKGLGAGVGIGGTLAGGKLGAYIGGVIGGPLGVAVGGAVGIGVSLLSFTLGNKSRKMIGEHRGKVTFEQLEEPINRFREALQSSIVKEVTTYFEDVSRSLDEFTQMQRQQLEQEAKEYELMRELSEEERQEEQNKLEENLIYLSNVSEVLKK